MEELSKQIFDLCVNSPSHDSIQKRLVELALKVQTVSAVSERKQQSNKNEKVAVLGLGSMGKGIALCLEREGYEVAKWNRSNCPEKNVSSIRDAVQNAEVVFTVLADDNAVSSVSEEIFLYLRHECVHVSLSTISLCLTRKLEAAHRERVQHFVSCPVFGRPDSAAKGLLFALPGGDEKIIHAVLPMLTAFSHKQFKFSTASQSALAKLCGNFLILTSIESLGEVFCISEKAGIDNKALLDMLLGSIFASPVFTRYGNILVSREFSPPGFAMHLGLKDVKLFLEAGDELRAPAPFAAVIRDRFLQTLSDSERAKLDWSAIFLSVRDCSGLN